MSNKCSNCGSEEVSFLFNNKDHISGELFPIERCNKCGLIRTSKMPNDLSKYYPREYYGHAGKRFNFAIEWAIGLLRKSRAKLVLKNQKVPGAVLDIGCGRGLMLKYLKDSGWRAEGVEYSQDLSNAAKRSYGIDVHVAQNIEECKFLDNTYDAVTMFHVLEHVPNPKKTLQEIYRILKPGGVCIIEVPNIYSWQALLTRGAWFHIDAPRHLFHFSLDFLRKSLAAIGFKVKEGSTNSFEFGYFGMIQSMLNLVCSRMNVFYDVLKNKAAMSKKSSTPDLIVTLLLLLPVTLISIPLELLAVLLGKGCVIRIVAKKINY
jgi:ubiquinone/menaquinone biosynthesis C-methylase UbiE